MANEKILVVEDSPTNLRLITELLMEAGYRVVTATDGDEATRKAINENPASNFPWLNKFNPI